MRTLNKSLRINLLLLLLILGLFLLLQLPAPEQKQTASSPPLSNIAVDTIQSIRLERGPNDDIVLQKQDGQWWMRSPLNWPANPARIQSLLALLQAPVYGHFSNQQQNLASLGLQPPQASIKLDHTTLHFGSTEALNNRRYLQLGDDIYMVDEASFYQVIAIVARYLSPRLLREEERITALSLPGLQLTQQQGTWHSSVAGTHADDIIALLQQWQTVNALSVDQAEGIDTQGKPRIRLSLSTQTRPLEFAIVQQQPDLLLLRLDNQLLYQLHPHQAQMLLQLNPSPSPVDK